MNEPFHLPVTYRNQELLFPAQLLQLGYTHKFAVTIDDAEVIFEPDEGGEYRAVVNPDDFSKDFNIEILEAVAKAIEDVLK